MNTPNTSGKKPEETKNKPEETSPKTQPEPSDKSAGTPPPDEVLVDETSHRVTPTDPDTVPKDTIRDAKERWETESPAVKGHPQQNIPEDVNAKETENPDGDDEDLLKKRDESGIA